MNLIKSMAMLIAICFMAVGLSACSGSFEGGAEGSGSGSVSSSGSGDSQ